MQKNQSTRDRVLHAAVGLGMLSMAFIGPRSPWALLGLIPIVIGMSGFEPVYRLLGISTHSRPAWPRRDDPR